MITLNRKGKSKNIFNSEVARIESEINSNRFLCSQGDDLMIELTTEEKSNFDKAVVKINNFNDLEEGDIVLIKPNGFILTIFRIKSNTNSLFVTDRCNSNCLMCSQPPKNIDDIDYYYRINTQLIKLIPKETKEIGITGGEPTLMGKLFFELIKLLNKDLPNTEIHILTNGRLFAGRKFTSNLLNLDISKVVFGIPLYSDIDSEHDYIVQAENAFNQTIKGIYHLARINARIEIRIVLHKLKFKRLSNLGEFIFMNLPFTEHVAFMGLELTGYSIKNKDLLFMEPKLYANQLSKSVLFLNNMGIISSIYNLPLCLVSEEIWSYCKNSISEWKREYLEECEKCSLFKYCGGVFATSKFQSNEIKAFID